MNIKIIGTESMGVRGLCSLVKTGERSIVIDPGLALGYMRNGLLPHPFQIAVGQRIRQDIINALETATDIVISHFHGDHIPLLHANPFQLSFQQLPGNFQNLRCWSKSDRDLPPKIQLRALELAEILGPNMKVAEGHSDGPLSFSEPVPHGVANGGFGSVMMTRIDMGDIIFVHASDIQLLDDSTVEKVLKWQPNIVLASGPPIYLRSISSNLRKKAWINALHLAANVDTLILDHHLLRCEEGAVWLDNLRDISGRNVCCGADFMGVPRLLLEARRPNLYQKMPVRENWHHDYFQNPEPLNIEQFTLGLT
jgi:uncharacterized protein